MTTPTIQALARELEAMPIEGASHSYQPIPFPEFAHLKTSIDLASLEAKLDLVRLVIERRRRLGLPGERLLDVGANAGFFSFSLAPAMKTVTAYEPHPRYATIGEALARERAQNVEWVHRPFTSLDAQSGEWDVALMLSVFQWITEGGTRLDEGRQILSELSRHVACLVFEQGLGAGASAIPATRRNHVSQIYELLRSSTTFEHVRLARSARLWKTRVPWRAWRHTFVCSHDDAFPEPPHGLLKHIAI